MREYPQEESRPSIKKQFLYAAAGVAALYMARAFVPSLIRYIKIKRM